MKRFLFALLPLAALVCTTGCMSSYVPAPAATRLSMLPTPYEGREIEVFFPGEKPKDTAFVNIAVLEEKVEGEVAYATLLDALKQKAQQQGMDALLLLGKSQYSQLRSDMTLLEVVSEIATGEEIPHNYFSVTTHELAAIGIKYRKNMEYLPRHLKAKHLFLPENGHQTPIATVPVNHLGFSTTLSTASPQFRQTYEALVQPYDLDHLLREESAAWRYHTYNGQARKRKLLAKEGVIKVVRIWYNDQALPNKLELRTNTDAVPHVITLTYNSQRQVLEKLVTRNKQPLVKEVTQYDAFGKLRSTVHFDLKEGKERPFLKTEYEYYPAAAL